MMAVAPAGVAGQLVVPAVSSAMTTALELRKPSIVHSKTSPAAEGWLQVWSAYNSS